MTTPQPAELKARLKALGLFGLAASFDQIADKPWLAEIMAIEERERQKRSLERRLRNSRVSMFKPMADFDWSWPRKLDREAVDDLFQFGFIESGHNAVLVGPNGVGKTMILKNLAHQAVVRGHNVRFTTASDMLAASRRRSRRRRSGAACGDTPWHTCSASTRSATSPTTAATPTCSSRSSRAATTPASPSCSAPTRPSPSGARSSRMPPAS